MPPCRPGNRSAIHHNTEPTKERHLAPHPPSLPERDVNWRIGPSRDPLFLVPGLRNQSRRSVDPGLSQDAARVEANSGRSLPHGVTPRR